MTADDDPAQYDASEMGYRISAIGEAFIFGSQLYECCASGARLLVKKLLCVAHESDFSAQTPARSSSIYTLVENIPP
jgi:hypothetical protein